jgi:hypothetical protein
MRNGQNKHRMRGRSRGGKSHNPLTRVYESNGPDVKIRGTPNHVAEKYIQLARDATASGDPVAAENYYQHAEHYFRLIAAAQEQFRQSQPYQQRDGDDGGDDGDDDSQPNYAEPHSPQSYQQQQPRESQHYQQREQPYQRDNQHNYQPRQDGRQDNRNDSRNNDSRNENRNDSRSDSRQDGRHDNRQHNQDSRPRHQDNRNTHQGNGAQDDTVDRLPSFITGTAVPDGSQANGSPEAQSGGDRFPSRRNSRRRDYRGPRTDRAASEGGDDTPQPTQPPAGE